MYKLQKKGRNQMNREEYNRVLEKLAEKRGITEAEAEQGLQDVLDDIFEYLDDTARSRWLKLAGKKRQNDDGRFCGMHGGIVSNRGEKTVIFAYV